MNINAPRWVVSLSVGCLLFSLGSGCSSTRAAASGEDARPGTAQLELTDEEAARIQEFVAVWVSAQTDDDGYYDIPPRGADDLGGRMADFRSVDRMDKDTYVVCVSFEDAGNLYDVDFVVDDTGFPFLSHSNT